MENTKLLSDELYNSLLCSIMEGVWKIGEKIPSESQICKLYGISRISVRSALHKLQALGLIVTHPGKGSFVIKNKIEETESLLDSIDLSVNDYKYMIELRRALEFTSIEILCKEGTAEDFQLLKNAYLAMFNAKDSKSYVDADYQFHYSIIIGSHNPVFLKVYDICKDMFYKYFSEMLLNNKDNNWDNSKNNHKRILDSICNRDYQTAISIIEDTFDFNFKRLSKYFKNK